MRLLGSGAGRIALISVFACVIAMSALNSALRTDSHHWGLMLSNALDLGAGRIPYKDFIIQYGYFTTLLQSAWGGLFGFSFLSFGVLTAIVYCGLLYQVYAVIRHLSAPWVAALFLAVAFVLHPFPVFPWSDYYAGFFLSFAVALMYTRDAASRARLIVAGILLGLAVWSRYTYAVAIVPFLLAVLIAGRYPIRGWMALFASFVATNLVFLSVLEYGYDIRLLDALAIYRGVVETHGTNWLAPERIGNLVALTRIEDSFLVYLWVATFPLFFEAARRKKLSRPELGAYAALSVLGLVNLIHAIWIFEHFRVINSSFALAIVSFWMIGAAVRATEGQRSADTLRHRALTGFVRRAPLILIVPLLLVAGFTLRILPKFPLNTHSNAPGVWRDPGELAELTWGKVGRVGFSHAGALAFYRALSAEICGHGSIYNLTLDNVVGHICDRPGRARLASSDKFLRLHDQSAYQRVYVRGQLSRDEVLVSVGQKDFLCLTSRDFIAPHIESVAAAGTRFVARRDCVGKLDFGRGWSINRRWAVSEHAEIHLRNYGSKPLRAKFTLTLGTLKPRTVTLRYNGKVQRSAHLVPERLLSISPDAFLLLPGDNLLQFDGDGPTKAPSDRAPMRLTYRLDIQLVGLSEDR